MLWPKFVVAVDEETGLTWFVGIHLDGSQNGRNREQNPTEDGVQGSHHVRGRK